MGNLFPGAAGYNGQPFPKHITLPVTGRRFSLRMDLFLETIHENLEGPKADKAIQRARAIAMVIRSCIGLLPSS